MASFTLNFTASKNQLSFRTPSGFLMDNGACSLLTDRGLSRPGAVKRGMAHRLHTHRLSGSAVEFWQSVRNVGATPLNISEIRMFDGRLAPDGAGWRAAHSELFKCDRFFENCNFWTDGFFVPLPGVEGDFGISEDWPFPGMFFTHPERGTLLMAALSQNRCKPFWSLRRQGRGTRLQAMDLFSGVPHILVNAGQELSSERWVMLFAPGGLEDAVEQYYRILRQRIDFHGTKSILRRAVVWGSWNYNYRPRSFCDITHKMVAANARALARLVPDKPRIAIIDDGYQWGRSREKSMQTWFSSCFEVFYDDGNPIHDPALFPGGMQAIAADIQKAGVMPALWVTPRINVQSALAKERPDWILQMEGGRTFRGRAAFLDYSLPEVRDFTRNVWHTIFKTWGFKGIKLDFWSLPFEVPQVRFRNQDRTAIELRNLFLQELREFVPKGGFVLVAVVCNGGGNPFVGRYADATRMGSDIGNGSCADVQGSAICLTTASPFYRHDCFLGDPDSVGWCPKNTPGQNRLWATMALLSGALCEIGGDLTALDPDARQLLKTVTRFFKPSCRTLNGIASGSINNLPAGHLVLERDDGVYEAYLNWMAWRREINLPRPVRDLWTGARLCGKYKLAPQDAILFKR